MWDVPVLDDPYHRHRRNSCPTLWQWLCCVTPVPEGRVPVGGAYGPVLGAQLPKYRTYTLLPTSNPRLSPRTHSGKPSVSKTKEQIFSLSTTHLTSSPDSRLGPVSLYGLLVSPHLVTTDRGCGSSRLFPQHPIRSGT